MGVTQAVADFVVRARPEPSPHAAEFGRALADTVAVAVAGVGSEAGRILLDYVRSERAAGAARVWGTDLTVSAAQAALVNGTAAHALDWDDAVPSMAMHPAAVLVPALVAGVAQAGVAQAGVAQAGVAQARVAQAGVAQAGVAHADAPSPVDGPSLVHAYDVGNAVLRAVSEALPLSWHYERGWHNTASTGRLAAVAALARLRRLDERRTRHALGIAASSVAGSRANFGTMTKPLHAGQAAHDAVVAVALAERGFSAHEHQLEAASGFFAMYGDTTTEALEALPERLAHWDLHWVDDWALKRHPSCYATHRAVDAALRLQARVGDPARIASVSVSVPAPSTTPLLDRLPVTGLEGKFSLEYTVSRTLLSGSLTLADFTDERVNDPVVRALMGRCRLERRDQDKGGAVVPHTGVTVTLDGGQTVTERVDITHGDSRNPMSDQELAAKFDSALGGAGWKPERASRLREDLLRVPGAPDLGWLQDAMGAER